ncbi:hypothetical protein AMTR_s00024p00078140 [Amborella trichopoda]|uniref:Prolamin-like domain-containing protein n=1 Tax=Amborella trichopoda TaxID=13333 RepID=W1PSL8_AMBTC|nr:hypothetical protein AMTR_s00024p00078140 [Amborella trichopoda]
MAVLGFTAAAGIHKENGNAEVAVPAAEGAVIFSESTAKCRAIIDKSLDDIVASMVKVPFPNRDFCRAFVKIDPSCYPYMLTAFYFSVDDCHRFKAYCESGAMKPGLQPSAP